jgi:hypothetical protein
VIDGPRFTLHAVRDGRRVESTHFTVEDAVYFAAALIDCNTAAPDILCGPGGAVVLDHAALRAQVHRVWDGEEPAPNDSDIGSLTAPGGSDNRSPDERGG